MEDIFLPIFSQKNFINTQDIAKKYEIMTDEINTFKKYLNDDLNILSIGSGIGGLEVLQRQFQRIQIYIY